MDFCCCFPAGFYNCPALAKDLPALLAEAREGGATCSLGPQWDASEEWGGLESLYPSLDVFIPNEVLVPYLCFRRVLLVLYYGCAVLLRCCQRSLLLRACFQGVGQSVCGCVFVQ